ncbi:hypothetical protein DWX10_27275 [Clostridium sp. AF18-27]|uniref:hypothetical protein n=1 Tax=Enterocloster lavalensis TaxID=460384 RepID=UPI000E552E63|nr:hypothetical protein [Enterocloster lavalensis]RHR46060.1 hypothetical protein DWX10_27275 [Clostridium sp. AF18-27]
MRTSIKKLAILMIVLCLSVSSSIISFAGEWKQDDIGCWYVNDDGSYTTKDWQIIDDVAYFFGSTGYMLKSATNWLELYEDGSYSGFTEEGYNATFMNIPTLSTGRDWEEMQAMTLGILVYQWLDRSITTREEVEEFVSNSLLNTITAEEQKELVDIITLKY